LTGRATLAVLLCIALMCGIGTATGEPDSRIEAEQQLKQVLEDIEALQRSLARSRTDFQSENNALKAVDLEIQASGRRIRQLAADQSARESELERLREERNENLQELTRNSEQLARQTRSAYQLGQQSRLKLLLNQDDPERVNRMLAYFEYFSRAQAGQIRQLRDALAVLDRLTAEIDRALVALAESRKIAAAEMVRLSDQRQQRQIVIDSISEQIHDEEARLTGLRRDRSDLETLLERLEDALSDIPADLGQHLDLVAARGKLQRPVNGRVMHAFGQSRTAGLVWHGWLIEAGIGTEVTAIAYGRVAFADWLRGYGLLMIIDHGDGFMSLYGHNEELLYDVGDWVQAGEPITMVGVNPGNTQGLYFELRRNGKALDPAAWLAKR
jgi:septal ring factor EnvC (AmiA/AmiB activator)